MSIIPMRISRWMNISSDTDSRWRTNVIFKPVDHVTGTISFNPVGESRRADGLIFLFSFSLSSGIHLSVRGNSLYLQHSHGALWISRTQINYYCYCLWNALFDVTSCDQVRSFDDFDLKIFLFALNRDCLWASIDPDSLFILSFIRCHFTVTCMIIFIFCTKVKVDDEKFMRKKRDSIFCLVMLYLSALSWWIYRSRSISFVGRRCRASRSGDEITIERWYWIRWIEHTRYGSRGDSSMSRRARRQCDRSSFSLLDGIKTFVHVDTCLENEDCTKG